ncbi:uncharacterized protein [Clytia hemisphaerica]|uniref:G domain-containing protein n=1 Tax=Clytia hemisphaerica TaxID=252671 RepID=A0A7M5X5T0_9CNID
MSTKEKGKQKASKAQQAAEALSKEVLSKGFLAKSLSEIEDVDESKSPYVVFVGNVGVGKSTVTEKLTGEVGRSSASSSSSTTTAEYFWVADKSLLIADTPGSNPRVSQKFDHNLEIAAALNYRNVSKLLIVVKASVRMDQTLADINEYVNRFVALPDDLVGVLVTHMDTKIEWKEEDLRKACEEDFGIEDIVFSHQNMPGKFIQTRILKVCNGEPFKLDIDGRLFLRLFNIQGNKKKVLKLTNDIVDRFKQYKQCFEDERKKFSPEEQADLFFEYKAFMELQVDESRKELCQKLGIDFCHEDDKVNIQHAGYVANMVNQLRAVIFDIRIEALKYHNNHGCSDLRECPVCGCVWAKVEGCDGWTTCGSIPTTVSDVNRDVFEMATFNFKVVQVNQNEVKFEIMSNGKKNIKMDGLNATIDAAFDEAIAKMDLSEFQVIGDKVFMNVPKECSNLYQGTKGCHQVIHWDYMKKVEAPGEFHVKDETQHVNVDDIMTLPKEAKSVFDVIDRQLKAKRKN